MPVIGCDCAVCQSTDPRDNRLRSAALLVDGDLVVLIDAGPDLRQQMLRSNIKHLDAILLTHEHNDHVIGLDDIRPFNFRSGHPMEVYALPRVAAEVRRRFDYVFGTPIPGLPRIALRNIGKDEALRFGALTIQPIEVMHGTLPILGYRIGDLCYLTDVKTIPAAEMEKLTGVRYLIVNALHHHPHPTHMNLKEALALLEQVKPEKAWLTHVSHSMGKSADVDSQLPEGVALGFDGLTVSF